MTQDEAYTLSLYQPIGPLEGTGHTLVQHRYNGTVALRKTARIYEREVYETLLRQPVAHVPRILALGEENGTLTVIEAYISGTTLAALAEQTGPMEPARVRELAMELCRILTELHSTEPPIIHRDIKPDNLLLDQSGQLWLLDLNAAKPHRPEQSRDTRLIGTQGYAAPEQYGFQTAGPGTDLYAVGVVMNWLLTGALPGEKRAQGPLEPVIRRCLKLDPKDRYPSAQAMLDDLGRIWLEGDRQRRDPAESWLPPGFRTGTPWKMLLALVGYVGLFSFCLTLKYEAHTWLNRLTILATFLSWIALWSNYRGIRRKLLRAKTRWGNALLGIAAMAVIFFLWIILLTFAESIAGA